MRRSAEDDLMVAVLTAGLLAIAAVYTLFSLTLQRKLANVDKMYEIRAKMNDGTKRLTEMIKANADKQEISAQQKEIMEISSQSMKLQLRPMLVILPLFAALYYLVLPMYFNMATPVVLPLIAYATSYRVLFIISLFVLGMLFSTLFSLYDRRRLRDKYNFGIMQPSFKQEPVQ